ncbi:hypothetical protein CANARDRAFT_5001 [[Candida] arabinofermentans NRRL YB-2248]|uniref:Mediator of RNA polymerase II transcription subunit 18 n=1 Tax=[Candida] arabinofermentans NRRL YB-2248 TaxID=983967 RepID=A0A1E4T7G4_9ASCO|nr:hypothetical protein CANARDRAFT_5001 [[Candida] arabinofermentans NRRL YB-2248]
MVQQLSLTCDIPKSQFQVLRITLESLTGMKPRELAQHTVILKPKFPFNPEQRAGKINQIESYRIRMTRIWGNKDPSQTNTTNEGESILDPVNKASIDDSIWTLQLSDIPAAGKRSVSIQNLYETTIYKTDDVLGYIDELGYMPEVEYWNSGLRFFYNDIIIEIFRLFVADAKAKSVNIDNEEDTSMTDLDSQTSDNKTPLKLLDGSGQFQIKCFVNVAKLNDLDNVARGAKQLESLKSELSGLIELDVRDRIMMDSRVGSRIASGSSNVRK